jgi:DNA-binding CsgD family transcriptional regulator/tetratricopeptide (TPR) repeat protein
VHNSRKDSDNGLDNRPKRQSWLAVHACVDDGPDVRAINDSGEAGQMTRAQTLERGRESYARGAWGDAYRRLRAADTEASLEPEDLERLATAAYLLGREDESEGFWERAHRTLLDRGDREGAARSACWLAAGLQLRGALAPASGWFARAQHILDEGQIECVVRGYLLIPSAIHRIVQGDPAAGDALFSQAAEIARRYRDRDLACKAAQGRGRALIRLGRVPEGIALLDQAMVAVIAGDVSPILAGDAYCTVLEGCQEIFDLRRAYEWTTRLARWCAAQPDLVRSRGECLLYRAEVFQMRGKWEEAARDAQDACELLRSRPAAGAACYRLGEIHRLRREFEQAEAAYMQANERGRKPQPGLSQLRLAQGHIDAAAASIRSVLSDTGTRAARARMLAAAVEILLAAGDVEHARAAATELSTIAGAIGAALLTAASAQASGAVLLAEGDSAGAARMFCQASEIWRDLEMPYEEAQTRVLMATVCERRSDLEGRRLEVEAAQRLFKQLNVEFGGVRIGKHPKPATTGPVGSLSEREAQVLRLVASGKTNRAIAEELFISEKTVARHVSNIFDKVGVSSRSAATAWAYQRNLI